MKNLLSALLIFLVLGGGSFAQQDIKPDITAEEEREAKRVAIAFFTSYQKTRDIRPLFRQYFVSDFERRLEYCRSTYECQGFARDFWTLNESLAALKPNREYYVRHYVAVTNVLYLASRTLKHLAEKEGKNLKDYDDEGFAKITDGYLSKKSKSVFDDIFDGSDNALGGLSSIRSLRKRIRECERLVNDLRMAEKIASQKLKRQDASNTLKPEDFWVGDEVNTGRFFDYPPGTKLIEVWPKEFEMPFKIDMIFESGRMRIVAIYVPMD